MGRYDLIRPITALASRLTTWNSVCDRKLHRLICYINSTLDTFLYAWVGDSIDKVELVLYCDADLAGDRTDGKSTSGVFLALMGPRTFVPLAAVSKKQTSVSKSTPEAEIVAIDHGMCKEGLPAAALWTTLLQRKVVIQLMEDNEAACRVLITGRNPSMKHMSRTQRIDKCWLNERINEGDFVFINCPSEYQGGDILTKHCVDKRVWARNLMLIGHFTRQQLISASAHEVCPAIPRLDSFDVQSSRVGNLSHILRHAANCGKFRRIIIEFCCSPQSLLGIHADSDCCVIRITKDIDANQLQTVAECSRVCKRPNVMLFGSIPCTGGSTWSYINTKTPSGAKKVRQHVLKMIPLFRTFSRLAEICASHGNVFAMEWPAYCTYWKRQDVKSFLNKHNCQHVVFDGCMLGLTDSDGISIKKPWRISSNSACITSMFEGVRCDRTHTHRHCRGKVAKNSEQYTPAFVGLVHEGFLNACR